jgi:hypothetical protein
VKRDARSEALRRLGVKPEQMRGVPEIQGQFRNHKEGIAGVIEAMRAFDEEDAQDFVEKYDSLSPSDRKRITISEVCVAAGLRPIDLLGTATKAVFQYSQTASSLISSSNHPAVTEKTVKMALTDGGHRDREFIHTAQGYLPLPKGATIIGRLTQVANFGDSDKPVEPAESPDSADLVPMDDDVLGLDAFERKMLPAGK